MLIISLAFITPVLADYLGPNREATTTSEVCQVVLRECKETSPNSFKYIKADEWSCASEGKEWQAYDNSTVACDDSGDVRRTQWGKEYFVSTTTIIHPEASINGELQNCTVQNGWCVTTPQLNITSNEPLSNYQITLIEGTRNQEIFACPELQNTCSLPLLEGENNFEYWAISSWGDTSRKGTSTAKVDTVAPNINLQVNGTLGLNNWYITDTTITAIGQDDTSGILESLLSVDGGTYIPTTTLSDGVYHIDVMAKDNALNTSTASVTLQVDTVTPTLSLTVNGTKGDNNFYTSNTKITANTSDATSGVATVQAKIDNGNWIDASEINLSDGLHTYQFRAYDNAGNFTESPIQQISIDTIPPIVEADVEINLGETIYYTLQDNESGLWIERIVIEDEDEKYEKIVWLQNITGNHLADEILWDGKFKDGIAAIGEYYITFKISDRAGNETFYTTVVNINLISYLQIIPEFIPPVSDELSSNEITSNEETSEQNFGGTPSTNDTESTTQTLTLNTSVTAGASANTTTTTTSNILWGAIAATAIGIATAHALDQQKKRDEEEQLQLAQVTASVDAQNAAIEANRIAMIEQLRIQNWLIAQQNLAEQEAKQNQRADEEFEENWNDARREHSLDTMSNIIHENTVAQAYQNYRQGELRTVFQINPPNSSLRYYDLSTKTYEEPVTSGDVLKKYIFFFPGAGNRGDWNLNGNLDDELDNYQQIFLSELRTKLPLSTIKTIYPYGTGPVDNPQKWYDLFFDTPYNYLNTNVLATFRSGQRMSFLPSIKANEIKNYLDVSCFNNSVTNCQVDLIGYSGGGQIAYSTAQALEGDIKVNNLILFGSPFRATPAPTNINHIWDIIGQQDTVRYTADKYGLGWSDWNKNFARIYDKEATECILYGSDLYPYVHYDTGYYFDQKVPFLGGDCASMPLTVDVSGNRLDANVELVLKVINNER